MKPGRNDPCPCGSGKKYKKCCLGKENLSVDLLWRRLGEAHDRLVHRLMKHARDVFGEMALAEALDEFLLWPDEDPYPDGLLRHEQFFYPWFLFNWVYHVEETEAGLGCPENITIAELYAARHGNRLDIIERRLIDATVNQPFSFYEVLACQPGRGYRLKDILRGNTVDVLEKMGSQNARKGDILCGQVIQIDDAAMIIGCGSVLIPPKMKPELIMFRNWLREVGDPITSETLREYDVEIRDLYFEIYDALTRPPELRNTDGDPFIIHSIYYEIDSPELAFERLKTLSVIDSEENLRADAELDEAGRIARVTIPWTRKGHKKSRALDNTVLGRLEINGRRLNVEVNSARRAEVIRKEIEKRLGKYARYKTTKIQSPEAMLETLGDSMEEGPVQGGEHDDLMQIPEIREHMEKLLVSHWKGWVDDKIPALGNKTPRQAVKTTDGRESVEALLLDAERHAARKEQMGDIELTAITDVRRRLGLNEPVSARGKRAGEDNKSERVALIKKMIEDFGQAKLTSTYTGFALKLCDRISRMRKLSIQQGRSEIWAASIVYVIARLNFLFDPENEIHITADELCDFFGTKKTTASSKAGVIQKTCRLYLGDEEFSSPEIARMFRIYETKEGLLIPGFMIHDPGNAERFHKTFAAARFGDKDGQKGRHSANDRPRSQPRDKKGKKSDRRQLNLFKDD